MKRLTVALADDSLYAALEAEASRRKQPLNQVVAEALQDWLESLEDAALLPSLASARAEWESEGGTEASEFFRDLRESPGDQRAP
jgi:hypothetical protein